MDIEEMVSCMHTARCLRAAGINTMEQLARMSKEDLLKIRGIGEVISTDLMEIIENYRQRKEL